MYGKCAEISENVRKMWEKCAEISGNPVLSSITNAWTDSTERGSRSDRNLEACQRSNVRDPWLVWHQKKTGSETLPQNVWKRVSLRVISYLFLKEVTFHTPSRFFEHYLVLFHTSCRHVSYLLVFIPIMTRFHTTRYIHTYILVLHTYTTSYSLRLSFIPGRLFTLWTLHTYLLLLHTCSSSYMFLLKFILTLSFLQYVTAE